MSDYISFRGEVLEAPPTFVLTRKAYDQMCSVADGIDTFLEFSCTKALLVTKSDDAFRFLWQDILFSCVVKKDQYSNRRHLLVTYIGPCDLNSRSLFLRYGLSLTLCEPVTVIDCTGSPRVCYYNGKQFNDTEIDKNSDAAITQLEALFAEIKTASVSTEEPLYQSLDHAEKYAQADYDFSVFKAQKAGVLIYNRIEGCTFERKDNIAYSFFTEDDNIDAFSENDSVSVENVEGRLINGTVIRKDGNRFDILFNRQLDIKVFPSVGAISQYVDDKTFTIQKNAFNAIKTGEGAAYAADMFSGISAGFDDEPLFELHRQLNLQQYPPTEMQWQAIKGGINARDYFFVKGPPGTGKTTVILEWVKYFTKQHKRVLVSSYTNNAVDNVLERLKDESALDILRIAREGNAAEAVQQFTFENKLEALRRNVAEKTEAGLNELKSELVCWQRFYDTINTDNFKAPFAKKRDIDAQLIRLNGQLNEIKEVLTKKKNAVKQARSQLKVLLEEADSLILAQRRHDNDKGLKKLFFRLFRGIRARRINKSIQAYQTLKAEEATLFSAYEVQSKKYSTVYESIIQLAGQCISEIVQPLNRAFSEALTVLPANGNQAFDYYGIRETDLATDDISDVIAVVEEDISSAYIARDALYDWQAAVSDSQLYALDEVLMESVDVVGATCIGIHTQPRFSKLSFDVTIIDEGGQIHLQNALVPMSVSDKLIMLGDDMQMPPNVNDEWLDYCNENEIDVSLADKSLFEMLYYDIPQENTVMLDTQFRMPAQIAQTLSEWFYGGLYRSIPAKENISGTLPMLSDMPFILIDTSNSKNRYERTFFSEGKKQHDNLLEAKIIAKAVLNLKQAGYPVEENVGIIAGLKAQVKCISNVLADMDLPTTMVKTLDSYQGQERDIIFYSFTRSANIPPNRIRIGFLNELRKLNVALSRSKKALVVIGDFNYLKTCAAVCDRDGNPVYDETKTEKHFGEFLTKLYNDVAGITVSPPRGQVISADDALILLEKEGFVWEKKKEKWMKV